MQKSDIEAALQPLANFVQFAEHNVFLPDPIVEKSFWVNGQETIAKITMEDCVKARIAIDFLKSLDPKPEDEANAVQVETSQGGETPPPPPPAEGISINGEATTAPADEAVVGDEAKAETTTNG